MTTTPPPPQAPPLGPLPAALRAEPMTAYDAVALFGVAVPCTVVMLLTICGAAVLARRYRPLRARNVPNLLFMTLCGAVHLWATTVVVMRRLWPSVYYGSAVSWSGAFGGGGGGGVWAAVLWTPWLEYFFGLGAWAALLFVRAVNYNMIFKQRFRHWTRRRRALLRVGTLLVFMTPALVLAVAGTFRSVALEREIHRHQLPPLPPPPPSPVPPSGPHPATPSGVPVMATLMHALHRPTWYAVLMTAWLATELGSCVALLAWMARRKRYRTKGSVLDEPAPMRFTLGVSVVALLPVVVLRSMPNVAGVTGTRGTVVIVIALWHTAVVLRYVARPLWHAVRRDAAYDAAFVRQHTMPDTVVPSAAPRRAAGPEHLSREGGGGMLALFMLYCRVCVAGGDASAATSDARRVRRIVDCLTLIHERTRHRTYVASARRIIDGYLVHRPSPTAPVAADALPDVPPPLPFLSWSTVDESTRQRAELFDALRTALVRDLYAAHWSAFRRRYAALVRDWRDDIDAQRRIMQQDGLLDPLSIGADVDATAGGAGGDIFEADGAFVNATASGGGAGGSGGGAFELSDIVHWTSSEDDDDADNYDSVALLDAGDTARAVSTRLLVPSLRIPPQAPQAGVRATTPPTSPVSTPVTTPRSSGVVTLGLYEYACAVWADADGESREGGLFFA